MSHHHSDELKTEPKPIVPPTEELHPFLSKNDLTLLTMAMPFLSPNGQKLISFFTTFNNRSPIQMPDFSGILSQFVNSGNSKILQELIPMIFNLASKMDQVSLDPSLLTSLLGILNDNHKPSNQDAVDS